MKTDVEIRGVLQHPLQRIVKVSASITKQVTFSIDHSSRCMCQEYKHQRVGHEFLTSVKISTKLTTNFETSRSTELIRNHHNIRNQWLLMQGTEVQNNRTRRKVAKILVQHAFHVINVTLFGSRGTSSANWLSSSSSKVSIPRFARFREDSNLGCISFHGEPRRTNNSQGARATSQSFVTTSPNCAAE